LPARTATCCWNGWTPPWVTRRYVRAAPVHCTNPGITASNTPWHWPSPACCCFYRPICYRSCPWTSSGRNLQPPFMKVPWYCFRKVSTGQPCWSFLPVSSSRCASCCSCCTSPAACIGTDPVHYCPMPSAITTTWMNGACSRCICWACWSPWSNSRAWPALFPVSVCTVLSRCCWSPR